MLPSSLTIKGTFSSMLFDAPTIPDAMVAQLTIPPKTLTNIALTFLSGRFKITVLNQPYSAYEKIYTKYLFLPDVRILNACRTCSSCTVPPTSRKLAGEAPYS